MRCIVTSFCKAASFALLLALTSIGFALPGIDPPPELVAELAPRLRTGQAAALVLIPDAIVEQVYVYESNAGLRHLRFLVTAAGESYPGIMYESDWTPIERELLESGEVSLVGLWETFRGSPSFTAKLVFGVADPIKPTPSEREEFAVGVDRSMLVRIDDARVEDVEPYFDTNGGNHVRFRFTVRGDARVFDGVVREGIWTRDMVLRLRVGPATLVGVWDESTSGPLFVVDEVR